MNQKTLYVCEYCGQGFDSTKECEEHEAKCIKNSYVDVCLKLKLNKNGLGVSTGAVFQDSKVKPVLEVEWYGWSNCLRFKMTFPASVPDKQRRLELLKQAAGWMLHKKTEIDERIAKLEKEIQE